MYHANGDNALNDIGLFKVYVIKHSFCGEKKGATYFELLFLGLRI